MLYVFNQSKIGNTDKLITKHNNHWLLCDCPGLIDYRLCVCVYGGVCSMYMSMCMDGGECGYLCLCSMCIVCICMCVYVSMCWNEKCIWSVCFIFCMKFVDNHDVCLTFVLCMKCVYDLFRMCEEWWSIWCDEWWSMYYLCLFFELYVYIYNSEIKQRVWLLSINLQGVHFYDLWVHAYYEMCECVGVCECVGMFAIVFVWSSGLVCVISVWADVYQWFWGFECVGVWL